MTNNYIKNKCKIKLIYLQIIIFILYKLYIKIKFNKNSSHINDYNLLKRNNCI